VLATVAYPDDIQARAVPAWKPFAPVAGAADIAAALDEVPADWSLTPLRDKRPYRDGWQTEPTLARSVLKTGLLTGEPCTSKTGKSYRGYCSGYGVRLGDVSDGLVAIDVDGASAEGLLQQLSGGELPLTVSWTSGKTGRRQLLYRVPQAWREAVRGARRRALRAAELTSGELLEVRYNRHQSALPPSRHPETGAYRWLRSPRDVEVAAAPQWLCELLAAEVAAERHAPSPAIAPLDSPRRSERLTGFVGQGTLVAGVQQAIATLGVEELYCWEGHQFRVQGNTWRGYCPRHQSQSGTAFAVDPDTKEWYCFGCGTGGGPVQYRHWLRGGSGSPVGAEFAAIARELTATAGIAEPAATEGEAIAPPDRARDTWQRSQQFTPDVRVEQPWFDWSVPAPNTLLAVKSGLGTGKTTWLAGVVEQLADEGWVALGHRNSLLLQSCERWGFRHLHADKAFAAIRHPRSKLALCVDSLRHFRPEDFAGKNVILDEAMAIARHLLVGGTLGHKRATILERFGAALAQARRIICLDALLADWCVAYLQQLGGDGRAVVKVENIYRGAALPVSVVAGERAALLPKLWASARPVVCTDSQLEAEALERLLQDAGRSGLRVDSKTIADPAVQAFLRDPDGYIRHHQPDYAIYTPSAEAGVDISIRDYFSEQFCLFFGVVQTHAQLQMLGRVRDLGVPRWVWCRDAGLRDLEGERSPFPERVAEAVEAFLLQEGLNALAGNPDAAALNRLMSQLASARDDEHYQTFCTLKAIANYERARLRDCLLERLQVAGHRVREVALAPSEAGAREQAAREAVKTREAEAIFDATPVAASDRLTLSAAERAGVTKARLLRLLPGIERSDRWRPELVRRMQFDERHFLVQQELFWLARHPDVAQRFLRSAPPTWHDQTTCGDLYNRQAQIRALLSLNIGEFLDLEREWTRDSTNLFVLVASCQARELRLALGLGRSESDPLRCLRRVLGVVGVKVDRRRVKRDRRRFEIFRLDRHAWYDPDRLAVLECLDRRWSRNGAVP